MKRIENKYDWFYEWRPQLITLFGVIGLLNNSPSGTHPHLRLISVASGLLLLAIAFQITKWRRENRRSRF